MSKNYEKELFAFAHRLSLNPDNALLRTALTHKSFTDNTETDLILEHNGKLAVLGKNQVKNQSIAHIKDMICYQRNGPGDILWLVFKILFLLHFVVLYL